MASGGKKKTTMAKLNRESRLRERRLDKQARKDARKAAAGLPDQPDQPDHALDADDLESAPTDDGPAVEAVVQVRSDD
jgi:hypothetical protein